MIRAVLMKFEGVVAHPTPSLCDYAASLVGRDDFDLAREVLDFYRARQPFDSYFPERLESIGVPAGDVLNIVMRLITALARPEAWRLYDDVPLAFDWMRERGIRVGVVVDWPVAVGQVMELAGVESGAMSVFERTGALSDAVWQASRELHASTDEMIYVAADHESDYEDARSLSCYTLVMDRIDRFDETVPNINHLVEVELHI